MPKCKTTENCEDISETLPDISSSLALITAYICKKTAAYMQ